VLVIANRRRITKKIEKKPRKKLLERRILLGLNTIQSCFLLWLHDKIRGGGGKMKFIE
jgi:hypothetical protein